MRASHKVLERTVRRVVGMVIVEGRRIIPSFAKEGITPSSTITTQTHARLARLPFEWHFR
jgi:hypothetical protein